MIKVAIVEDTTELRHLWTDILNHTEGYVCVGSFSNAADAVMKLPTSTADIILMDIQLSPTESGIEVIRQVKTQCLDSQFLMFTVFENDEAIFESLKAGATGYILKNTTPTKVLDAIRELHEGGSPMSAAIARRVTAFFHQKPPSPQEIGIQAQSFDELNHLSAKENQILERLAKGFFYKEIAADLSMSVGMVKQNLHTVYKKLHVANRTEAINKFLKR